MNSFSKNPKILSYCTVKLSFLQPAMPSLISKEEQLYNDITSIKGLRMIKTDTGRARAWIRSEHKAYLTVT